jgi:hypothetical protein
MIIGALEGHDASGERLLDIGAHWGYMTQQMEAFGFECTAVEGSKSCARFARVIRIATESKFAVWEGDILDFPNPEQYEVVLALGVFHHFLKTPELHGKLVDFLGRLSAETIIVEPHVEAPLGGIGDACHSYAPREFAEFVREHTRLDHVERLGIAPDGRSLFKISR